MVPDCYSVDPLTYHSSRPASSGLSMCMLVGIVVVAVFLMTQPAAHHHVPRPMAGAMAMVATVGRTVSARIAGTATPGVQKASVRWTDIPPEANVDLVDSRDVAEDGTAANMSEADKQACASQVTSWLGAHPTGIVMVFAHWCHHCHRMAPNVVDASMKHGVPALMIHAEAVPRAMLTGSDALVDVKYFPLVLAWKDEALTPVADAEAAVDAVAAASAPAAAKTAAAPAAEEPTVETSAMLAHLF